MTDHTNKEVRRSVAAIEQGINRILSVSAAPAMAKERVGEPDPAVLEQFRRETDEDESLQGREDLAFIREHLRRRGYVKERAKAVSDADPDDDSDIDYARFVLDADIGQSVWSRYAGGKNARTSHDTLLKIVLGLRLDEKEARLYLALTGSGFALRTDKIDQIVLSYIRQDYLGNEGAGDIANTMHTLFLLYAEDTTDEKLKKRFENFYDL